MPKPRAKSTKQPAKTMRIYCEGEKTEPYYINGYIQSRRSDNRAAVVEIQPTKKNTPVQLVEEAINFKKSSSCLPYDEIWVVYDRENIAKYSHALHAQAWDKARASNIELAISNVCFEHWLLLHLDDTGVAYSCFDDLNKNSPLNQRFRDLTGGPYEKSGREIFSCLEPFVDRAITRALRINHIGIISAKPGVRPFEINPYTSIPDLLTAIDKFK